MSKKKFQKYLPKPTWTFPLYIECDLDPSVHRRLLRREDAQALYKLFKDDKELMWLISGWGYKKPPQTLAGFEKLVKKLLRKYHKKQLVPYVDVLNGEVFGLDCYAIYENSPDKGEVETMVIYGELYRGKGLHQVVTHSRLKVIAEMGLTSTRYVEYKNQRSWWATFQSGVLDRNERWGSHSYDVFIVTPQSWLWVDGTIQEKLVERRHQTA